MRPTSPYARTRLAATTAVVGTVSLVLTAAPASAQERPSESSGLRFVAVTPPPAEYTIRAGDTISGVATRFGLRTLDVLTWNGLGWSSVIHPGQVISLVAPAVPAAAAPSTPASPAPAASAPASAAGTHVVVSGDTLWAVAQGAGVSLDALLSANGLGRDAIIYPGQSLVLPASVDAATAAARAAGLDDEQIANARIIIEVGRSRGVSDRGIAIALATAMVESWIRNLDSGDRDSRGLFQQRPSTGWGTADEVRDPHRATAAFFGGPSDPNGPRTRGLLDIPGWEAMEFGAAAQAVQVSAHPDRYAPWEEQASAWLAILG